MAHIMAFGVDREGFVGILADANDEFPGLLSSRSGGGKREPILFVYFNPFLSGLAELRIHFALVVTVDPAKHKARETKRLHASPASL